MLRQRDFRLLFAGQAVSFFGDRMVNVALAFAVLDLGHSASEVGLVFAARTLPLVLCLLAGGVVADRVSRRAVMVGADLVRLASQGALAALLIGGAAEVWSIAVLAAVTGAATGFFNPASTGLLPELVAPEDLQPANGLRATAAAAGEIGGPVTAGLLVASAGAGWALAIDAATFALSASFLARLRLPRRLERASTGYLADLRAGWGEFRARRWVWTVVGAVARREHAVGRVDRARARGRGPRAGRRGGLGTVLAVMGAGTLLGGVAAVRIRPRRPLVLFALGGVTFALPLGLLAAGAHAGPLAAGAFFAGVAMMLGNSVWEATLQRHIPAESLSRVSAYDWFGSLAFYPLGLAVWAPIADAAGAGPALWAACALQVAVSLALLAVPEVRRLGLRPA